MLAPDAEPPTLEVREHPVDPRQHLVRRMIADHGLLQVRQAFASKPSVGREPLQRRRRTIPHHPQLDPPPAFPPA